MARKAKKKRTGPHPERVKIKGDWETAVGKALKKERPKAGWRSNAAPNSNRA